ncbi:Very-long-chain (3R)-3-hydroxyacyl-CoA dehydratase PASTICCINO 2 [Aphanomyces cochlioides]|nr:Very-long-chain (3R)-3-hydroxyacyl-CoA dehydratase PASTICCINO 2 [Aphanomyces cochlioides]
MIKNLYLTLYNLACCAGWAYVLGLTFQTVNQDRNIDVSTAKLWDIVEIPLKIVQTAAFMEILHAMFGIVRSPVFSTVLQVSSRLALLWMINDLVPETRTHWGFVMMVTSWSLVEVPRYAFYALNLWNAVPDWLFFLRYHLFMVLYPTGISGEVSCMLSALPYVTNGAYAIQMPNDHNVAISLQFMIYLTLVVYVPGSPFMYQNMNNMRKKAYAKKNEAKTLKKD